MTAPWMQRCDHCCEVEPLYGICPCCDLRVCESCYDSHSCDGCNAHELGRGCDRHGPPPPEEPWDLFDEDGGG